MTPKQEYVARKLARAVAGKKRTFRMVRGEQIGAGELAAFETKQRKVLEQAWDARCEREFVKDHGFHSDGSPTLGTLARGGW